MYIYKERERNVYTSLCFNMFLSLIMSIITNPGQLYLTQALEPLLSDTTSKSYCKTCHMHRPPRSFHCSHCGHCVRRMDFHYSWLNNCVGEDNHHIFLLTIIYTLFFCITTLILTVLHFYYYPKCITCDKQIFYIKHSIWFIYTLNIILIYGLFQSLIMFVVQHLNIIMNRTTVENVLLTPVVDYTPYTKFESYADLFKTTNILLWPFPCKRQPFSSQFDSTATTTTDVASIIATTTAAAATTTTTTTPTLEALEASEEDHANHQNGLV
ncbi:probable palmitoyltransferase ZDHHC21 [Octopus vulgaris]|uniref:Palmitoyltransferase n=1 Tax=Octopus vulgaris TaxID=6645 RepID=A0AA36BYU8_OCTVU|nr:probable palmitoyltransferase ZDHHC21 [Octopus vulgaris]